MTFAERKKERTEYYEKHVKGWKLRDCSACSGSGYYDHDGSPACGACDGTGKERYKPDNRSDYDKAMEYYNKNIKYYENELSMAIERDNDNHTFQLKSKVVDLKWKRSRLIKANKGDAV